MEGWRLALGVLVGGGAIVFLVGALLYHRRLIRTGGVLMGLALLGVLGGSATIVSSALEVTEVAEVAQPPTRSREGFEDACHRRVFFADDEGICACATEAFEATQTEHPGLFHRATNAELIVDGPRPGVIAFHDRLAECAGPRVSRWVEAHCRADCGPGTIGCPSRCTCTGQRVRSERSPTRVAYMFFPEPGPAPADRLEAAMQAADLACRPSDVGDGRAVPIPGDGNN